MRYYFMTFSLIFGLFSTPATGQNYDYRNNHSFGVTDNQVGISSGVKLTIPFTAQAHQPKGEARIGFTLSLDNRSQRHWTDSRLAHSTDILELGFFETGDPNIMLMGQKIYEPLFSPHELNAKTKDGTTSDVNSKTLLYLAGGAAILTGLAVVLVKDSTDDLVNCNFNTESNVPECR